MKKFIVFIYIILFALNEFISSKTFIIMIIFLNFY